MRMWRIAHPKTVFEEWLFNYWQVVPDAVKLQRVSYEVQMERCKAAAGNRNVMSVVCPVYT